MIVGTEPAWAYVSLPAIFTDNMVLQRDTDVKIWGWGKPLEQVTIKTSWSMDYYKTIIDNKGNWDIILPTPEAGGPYEINIQGQNEVTLRDVLIGEVWLCSGQSNMEWSANMGINNQQKAIQYADNQNIRFFTVNQRTASEPQIDLDGDGWNTCSPKTMADFSAVAYFFARRINEEMGIPVGLIQSAWGGTPAEAWVSGRIIDGDSLLAEAAKLLPEEPWGPGDPGSIFHAMISPITSFKIAGVLWYQGERNTNNPSFYKELMVTLINSWRTAWGYDFPFYFAQIAPFNGYGKDRGVLVQDAQRRTLEVPGTKMVMTSDISDRGDIHPTNKQDVGLRFANLALVYHYKIFPFEVIGPLYRSYAYERNRVRIFFDHAEGLHARDGNCNDFELAGEDGVFHPAGAKIEGGSVLVSAGNVFRPKFCRFAWRNDAVTNLFNQAGLPASCFLIQLN
jgi:sialate O-acetylesterase